MNLSDLLGGARQIIVLAGAGLSAPPPTCLPGWWAINDAVLGALGDAIESVSGTPGLAQGFRDAIRERRNNTPFLMPDLQAQLLEDELGPAYFRSLASLDSSDANPAHHLLVELVSQGLVRAVLTTNFDCTIERAFDAASVPYRLFTSPEDFERLDEKADPVPVVKIHGSADRPNTMVDTLRQRLQGRPASLEDWMHRQFTHCPTVSAGFSCEDLRYNREYLSILPALRDGARFCFLVRRGENPSVPLQQLHDDFPHQVGLAVGELPSWLFEVAGALGGKKTTPDPIPFSPKDVEQWRAGALQRVETSLSGWATSLGAMDALNAVTALLRAAGHRHDADYLLRRMWEFYRGPSDCTGPAYVRYLHNYGEVLLRRGNLRNVHDRETDLPAWKAAADQDPRQFFYRAVMSGGGENTRARLLLCEYLAGKNVPALAASTLALLESLSKPSADRPSSSTILIDAAFSLAEVLELVGLGQGATKLLEDAHRSAATLGDEFRRAEAAWRLARNLAFGLVQNPDAKHQVDELTTQCCEIAGRLNIREATAGALLARSIAAIAGGAWDMATKYSREAESLYREVEDRYGEVFARRERVRALIGLAAEGGSFDGAQFDELSDALQRFAIDNAPGLRSLIKFELANLARFFDLDLARNLATDAEEDALLQNHQVLVAASRDLKNSLLGDPGRTAGTEVI